MLTLLSPAKKLDLEPTNSLIDPTTPSLTSDTKILARIAKEQTAQDLKNLMGISDALADLNVDRYRSFTLNGRSNSAKPAVFAFNGDVYWGLDAKTMTANDLIYAQDHMRIISGLYGVLRPMDAIQPYRLEMGTKLKTPRGKNLYEFWGNKIASSLNSDLEAHKDKSIINLASNEYFKAIDKKAWTAPIIDFSFLNIKDGQARSLMFYAKRARGLMARWVMDNKIETAEDLRGFDVEGYTLDTKASSDTKLVFTRLQPPPKK